MNPRDRGALWNPHEYPCRLGINTGIGPFFPERTIISMIQWTRVDGRNSGHIKLFALSTCVWCKKTKRLLGELGIGYDYVDVDLLTGADNTTAKEEIARWNPRGSFPTIVVDDERSIVGFDEAEIRKLAEE